MGAMGSDSCAPLIPVEPLLFQLDSFFAELRKRTFEQFRVHYNDRGSV